MLTSLYFSKWTEVLFFVSGLYKRLEKSRPFILNGWINSTWPIISFKVLQPNKAKYSLTSSAIKYIKLITFASFPLKLWRSFSFCVATPKGQVFKLQTLSILQPIVIKGALEKLYKSAPRIAAIITSKPVSSLPSVSSLTRLRKSFIISVWWASLNPISKGIPAWETLVLGAAPVPPLKPEIKILLAPALTTPDAIVPTPASLTSLTEIFAWGFALLKSYINCAKSSIE